MKTRSYRYSGRAVFAGEFSNSILGLFPFAEANLHAQPTNFTDSAATAGRTFYRAQQQ